jgi:hypothetical protein
MFHNFCAGQRLRRPFNPSANAKPTEARRKQMVLALGSVTKFVMQILDGSIAQTRSCIAATFGTRMTTAVVTRRGPIALNVLFETYKRWRHDVADCGSVCRSDGRAQAVAFGSDAHSCDRKTRREARRPSDECRRSQCRQCGGGDSREPAPRRSARAAAYARASTRAPVAEMERVLQCVCG